MMTDAYEGKSLSGEIDDEAEEHVVASVGSWLNEIDKDHPAWRGGRICGELVQLVKNAFL